LSGSRAAGAGPKKSGVGGADDLLLEDDDDLLTPSSTFTRKTIDPAERDGDKGDALPIILGEEPREGPLVPDLLGHVSAELVEAAVNAVLASGVGEAGEKQLLLMLKSPRVPWGARQEALSRLMSQASSTDVRQEARKEFRPNSLGRYDKLRRVARVFAWG